MNLNFTAGPQNLAYAVERAGIRTILTSRRFLAKAEIAEMPGMVMLEDLLRTFSTPQDKVITVFANERAASLTDLAALPYPYGSIIVFERRNPLKDAAGATLRDDKGQVRGGDVFQIDVMRREKGFGESYRDVRTGEWEFASYRPDGTFLTPPDRTSTCATCHMKAAARDFVFRGRFPALPGQ